MEGLEHLAAGTPVAFSDRLRIENGYFKGQLDNILSAAALVHLFSLGYQGTAFFTAQEEAGRSWRYLLEWFRRFGGTTNQLIVTDTSPYADVELSNQQQVVLRHRDANALFNEQTTQHLIRCCDELQISYSFKDDYIDSLNKIAVAAGEAPRSIGSTEMGRITAASNGLVHGTTLQIPTTNYHTMDESASIEACQAFLAVLRRIAAIE